MIQHLDFVVHSCRNSAGGNAAERSELERSSTFKDPAVPEEIQSIALKRSSGRNTKHNCETVALMNVIVSHLLFFH